MNFSRFVGGEEFPVKQDTDPASVALRFQVLEKLCVLEVPKYLN